MKIENSSVQMSSQWAEIIQHSERTAVEFWDQRQDQPTNEGILVDISDEGKTLQQNMLVGTKDSIDKSTPLDLSDRDKEKISLLEDFIYILTGKRMKLFVPTLKIDQAKLAELKARQISQSASGGVQVRRQGWGLRIDAQESTHETEKMAFSSSGSVTTADGRTIDFNLDFRVSREFTEQKSLSIKAGDALLDPLVVNFSNASATLGERNYSFDIDTDGENETIAFTGAGSGFLALDVNGNNAIDNGSELFGPQTGNGFGELAGYDGDKNGWIDENDEIFNKLKIWTLDENGDKTLLALGQAGIGAIYLGNVQSEFNLKTLTNDTMGKVRQTGIFLKETGEAGTIQHVDLAI